MAVYSVVEVLDAENSTQFANSSNVKFGSWDAEAIVGGNELQLFKCQDLTAWRVKAKNFDIGSDAFIAGTTRYLEINPHLPYLYLPDEDWTKFEEIITKTYEDILCSYRLNVCYWNMPCERAPKKGKTFKMEVFDDVGSMFIDADEHEMRVDGE